jgi:hypothetical protein
MQLIIYVLALICIQLSGALKLAPLSNRAVFYRNQNRLSARVARNEDKTQQTTDGGAMEPDDGMMSIPQGGLIGYQPGSLFKKEVDVYDPMKDTDSLPGEDGSAEKIAAIQKRIQDRVEDLKKRGEWEDNQDSFGSDPLARQSIVTTMVQQVQICKPYDSVGELILTFLLVLGSTLFMMLYLFGLKGGLEVGVGSFMNTDFDSDFLSNLLNRK